MIDMVKKQDKKAEAGGLVMIKLIPLILIVLVIIAVIIAFLIWDIPDIIRNFIPDFMQPGGGDNEKIRYRTECNLPVAKIMDVRDTGMKGIYFFDTTGKLSYYYSRFYLKGLNIYADERRLDVSKYEKDSNVGTVYRGLVIMDNKILNKWGDLYDEVLEDFLEDSYIKDHLTQHHNDVLRLHGSYFYKNITTQEDFLCRDEEFVEKSRDLYEEEHFATLNRDLEFVYFDKLMGVQKLSLKIVETEEGTEIRTKKGSKTIGYLRKENIVFMNPGFQSIMGFSRYGKNYHDKDYGLKEFTAYNPGSWGINSINNAFLNMEAADKLHESKFISGNFYAKKKEVVKPVVKNFGVSKTLRLVFDEGFLSFSFVDKAVVSWDFTREIPVISLFPNGKTLDFTLIPENINRLNDLIITNDLSAKQIRFVRGMLSTKDPQGFAMSIKDAIGSGGASIDNDGNYGVHWKEISYLLYGVEIPPKQGELVGSGETS